MKPTLRDTFDYLPSACVALLESGPDGEQLMRLVVQKLGGQCVAVPTILRPCHLLAKALGFETALRVWKIWRIGCGEISVYIPLMTMARHKERRLALLRLRDKGVTVSDAARRLSLSERSIYSMLRKSRELGESAGDSR